MVWAVPCFSGGKLSSRTPWLLGCSPPPANPCNTRKTMICPRLLAKPHKADASVKTPIDSRK